MEAITPVFALLVAACAVILVYRQIREDKKIRDEILGIHERLSRQESIERQRHNELARELAALKAQFNELPPEEQTKVKARAKTPRRSKKPALPGRLLVIEKPPEEETKESP